MEGKIRLVSPFKTALYLKRVAPLHELAPEHLAVVAQQARERFFPRGATLWQAGMAVQSFHVVVEGHIHVQSAEHGDTVLGADETLGLLSLLARWPEGLEAMAETETRTLEIDGDDLDDVFEDHFAILHNEIRTLACRTLQQRMQIPTGTYLAPAEGRLSVPERGLDLVDRLHFLQYSPFLKRANLDALIQLANHAAEVHFEQGTTLWKAGDPSGYLCALVAGRVRCTLPDGRWFLCGPGYPLGNLESQCGTPRWYEASADTHVMALRGETDTFTDTLEDHFEMAREVLASMAAGLIRILVEQRQAERRPGDSELAQALD